MLSKIGCRACFLEVLPEIDLVAISAGSCVKFEIRWNQWECYSRNSASVNQPAHGEENQNLYGLATSTPRRAARVGTPHLWLDYEKRIEPKRWLGLAGSRFGQESLDRSSSLCAALLLQFVNPIRHCLNHIARCFTRRVRLLHGFLANALAFLDHPNCFLSWHFYFTFVGESTLWAIPLQVPLIIPIKGLKRFFFHRVP
jgi:hypothetical protein